MNHKYIGMFVLTILFGAQTAQPFVEKLNNFVGSYAENHDSDSLIFNKCAWGTAAVFGSLYIVTKLYSLYEYTKLCKKTDKEFLEDASELVKEIQDKFGSIFSHMNKDVSKQLHQVIKESQTNSAHPYITYVSHVDNCINQINNIKLHLKKRLKTLSSQEASLALEYENVSKQLTELKHQLKELSFVIKKTYEYNKEVEFKQTLMQSSTFKHKTFDNTSISNSNNIEKDSQAQWFNKFEFNFNPFL